MSPYFSPKSIIAPSRRASSIGVSKTCTGRLSKICSLTRRSTSSRSSAVKRLLVREVEPELVGPHGGSRLPHVLAEHVPQRLVQQMRPRVVRHRREADAPRHDRAHAVARGESGAAQEQRLVVAEAVRLDELGARPGPVVELDVALVRHLAAAGRVERRLAELREEEPVLELLERAELREDVRLP